MSGLSCSKSQAHFQQACRVIPGGVNSPARAFGAVGGDPLIIQRGEGPHLFDIDGNRFIDYVGSWGPLILWHRNQSLIAAVQDVLERGMTFVAPSVF